MDKNHVMTARNVQTVHAEAGPEAIVDAHHHIWHLAGTDAGHYPWLQDRYDAQKFFLGDYASLRRDFNAEDYLAHWPGIRIDGTVHVEAERDRAESLAETAWLHAQHARHGLPGAVVAYVDLLRDDRDEALRAQLRYPSCAACDASHGPTRTPCAIRAGVPAWKHWSRMDCRGTCACPTGNWKQPPR